MAIAESKSSSSEPRNTKGCWREFNLRFGRLSGSSDGSTASEAWNVLLFLLSGFEDLLFKAYVSYVI